MNALRSRATIVVLSAFSLLVPTVAFAALGDQAKMTSSGLRAERTDRLAPENGKKVIFSVQLGTTAVGDKLKVRGEVGFSNEMATKTKQSGAELWNGEWRYRVHMYSKIILANSATETTGVTLADVKDSIVSPVRHHEQFSFSDSYLPTSNLAGKYVNLVSWSTMENTSTRPSNCYTLSSIQNATNFGSDCLVSVEKGHGKLDVVRQLGSGDATWTKTDVATSTKLASSVPCPTATNTPMRVAYAIPLGNIRAGEVLDVQAAIGVSSNFANYNSALASGKIIIGNSSSSTDGEIVADQNGFNLTYNNTSSTLRKAGAYRAGTAMTGKSLNLVMRSGGGCDAGQGQLNLGSGQMTVSRYRPAY
jgi:hypothetical protein